MSDERRWDFKFSVPPRAASQLIELSHAEIEDVLLNQLRDAGENPTEALWQLARFYSHARQHEAALEYLRRLLELQGDLEQKAATVLAMGQTMEQVGEFEAAVRYYREAFALEPMQTHTWYFINNNLGYSLNRLGQFSEGERFCRAAIAIAGTRPNGFKNLGLSLRGQGRFAEAAEAFVRATQADASDGRARKHLEELLAEHPELEFDFAEPLECCRLAVAAANQHHASLPKPIVHRGFWKKLFLLRARIQAWWRRVRG